MSDLSYALKSLAWITDERARQSGFPLVALLKSRSRDCEPLLIMVNAFVTF